MATHLGKTTFLDTPDVNGSPLLTAANLTGTANQITQTGGVLALAPNAVFPGTSGVVLPVGTTAQRPASPVIGQTRYNSTLAEPEIYSGSAWLPYARLIQSVAGPINNTSGTGTKSNTNVPLVTEGLQIWTTSFTPLVVGSTLVVQYCLSAYSSTAARLLYTSAFAGSTCIGTSAAWNNTTGAVSGGGLVQLAFQCVYVTTSLTPMTIQGRCGIYTTNASPGQLGINQLFGGATFGSSMITEYRILEIV